MDTIYSKDNCPACESLKAKYKAEGKQYKELKIGRDISLEEFIAIYPKVRTVPYVVKSE